MKKNKKQILLTIIVLSISTILFTSRVDAVVMWMQCTDSVNNNISDSDDFKYYSSFAIVNNKSNSDVRNLVYDSTGFFSSKGPTFIIYDSHDGMDTGNICWYNKYYEDIHGPMGDCDSDEDFVPASELLKGTCPELVIDNTDGWFTDTGGAVRGDMLVLQGKKTAPHTESLYESQLVIYGFKDKEGQSAIMIEGYNSSGLYGYATTWKDWDTFTEKLNMKENDSDFDLINEEEYDTKYMSWPAMTQARRVNKFGKNYFKLLDNSRPWLVGTVDEQEFTVTEKINGKNVMYRSDDSNNNFYNWVSEWYKKYEEKLSEQIKAMENLKSEKYKKAYEASKEISTAVDTAKEYNFDSSYSASQMVIDLNNAYNELNKILSKEEGTFESYDSECNLTEQNTNDALAAVYTQFACETFGVSSTSLLENKTNPGQLDAIITSTLSTALGKYSKSDTSLVTIQSDAQEYAKLFATAIKYIKKNEVLTGEAETLIKTLEENYTKMTKDFGAEIIVTCEDLIDEKLRDKIGSYLNIIKIAVPIILILFGIIDFCKAVFAGDEEKMKKAQKDFIMRLGIAIIFFLIPTIVDFLLSIANKVWNFIEPGSCGIFNS